MFVKLSIRELSALERTSAWLTELIGICEPLRGVHGKEPKLTADVTRKAKALRTSLGKLQAALEKSK